MFIDDYLEKHGARKLQVRHEGKATGWFYGQAGGNVDNDDRMMMEGTGFSIRTIAKIARAVLGYRSTLDDVEILGKTLRLRAGTVRDSPDYDDTWFFLCLTQARAVVDVGANIGQGAVLACLIDSISDVVLVEANPEALLVASENLIVNNLVQKVRMVCAYAGSVDKGSIRFWTVGSGAAGSSYASHAKTAKRKGISFEVPTVTIDSVCERYALIPDLVKVDVEGAEKDVLAGSIGLALKHQTRFLVEMHSNINLPMRDNCRAILQWVRRCRYRAWYLADGVELTTEDQVSHRGRCHLLLQPESWDYPAWLVGVPQSADPRVYVGDSFL